MSIHAQNTGTLQLPGHRSPYPIQPPVPHIRWHLASQPEIHPRPLAELTVLRLGAVSLFALAGGPWLDWLSLDLLERLPGRPVRPLPVDIGRFRYRSGFVARRPAEDLAPFRALEQTVRDIAC